MSIYATIELNISGHQNLPPEMDPNAEGLVYGQNLGQCDGLDELDLIAVAAGAKPISSFMDDSEMLDDKEREEFGLPPAEEKWSPIDDGIKTIEILIAELERGAGHSPIGKYPIYAILWDLRAVLTILKSASPPDELFRFVVM
jgi:hypothetical protein